MFEVAELGQKLDKATWKARVPGLRERLLDMQDRLRDARLAVVVVLAGVEASGKGEVTNTLLEWLDARHVRAHAIGHPTAEETERPRFFRFWRRLPPKGRIGLFLGSWYTFPIIDRTFDRIDDAQYDVELARVVEFERMLDAEDVVVVKVWLHLTQEVQRKRMKSLAKDPATSWRVTERDWSFHERYDDFVRVCAHGLRRTSTGHAPWHVIEATNRRFRDLAVVTRILDAVEHRLARPPVPPARPEPIPPPPAVNLLSALDLTRRLPSKDADRAIRKLQARLAFLARSIADARLSMAIAFEGPDAAGKGGAIRRVVHALDARFYEVVPVAAPTDEERAQPYLWRFWRHVPSYGRVTLFDRSWYGRVLVERVEGLARPEAWQRAYGEINEFEEQLVGSGVVLLKFWMAISPEEQLRRFEERERTGYKRYKITDEDWRNRERWDDYVAAACEAFERTSTEIAPWTLVEAEDKGWARVKVLTTVVERLERALADADPARG